MMTYLRNNETISGRLSDELVMMDIQKGKYFSLNPVATRIWDFLEEPLTLDQICEKLMMEYEVNQDQCRYEVASLIAEMEKQGLVKLLEIP